MIIAEELCKWFDDFLAVDQVSLKVDQGRVLALLGQNGAGKTTTVRMLTSILRPTSGRACVAGFDVATQPEQVRRSVGVLTENHGLYGRMNAQEYLEFFGGLYDQPVAVQKVRIKQLMEGFGLGHVLKKRLGEYSKGMRQKLALVRAMLHDPPVLLLDEPTSAMDPESARTVRDAIQSLRSSGRTILLCTHNLAEAEELADQVAIIRRGKILLNDTLDNVKHQLLGQAEYEVRLAYPLNGWQAELPAGVELLSQGENWLRFHIHDPLVNNPALLRQMLSARLEVVSFHEVPRSLERAFLNALGLAEGIENGSTS
jgi:ABC-2 type transport system ATP-binding protein